MVLCKAKFDVVEFFKWPFYLPQVLRKVLSICQSPDILHDCRERSVFVKQ